MSSPLDERSGRPDHRNARPQVSVATSGSSTHTEYDPWKLSAEQRRDLLESLPGDYILGHELGVTVAWGAGWAAGWDACEQDVASAWAKVAGEVRKRAGRPSSAEVRARREPDHQPCPRKCGKCSTCIHSQAWYARGRRPFLGVAAEAELARAAS